MPGSRGRPVYDHCGYVPGPEEIAKVNPVTAPDREGWWFDDEAIRVLRRIERLRVDYNMNLTGLRVVSELFREVERLREEVRALRRS